MGNRTSARTTTTTRRPHPELGIPGCIRTWLTRALLLVRLTPFDTSTELGRSRERYRRVALTTVASILARGISLLTLLISVPLTLNYLGTERYGMWMTISSVVAILSFADLGIGNGLMNAISEANGMDDRMAARMYVSSALGMLSALALGLAVLFCLAYPFIRWETIFRVSSPEAVAEAGPAIAVFAGCFFLSIPAGVVQRVQMGYQQGFASSLWAGLGNAFGLAGVLFAVRVEAGLPWLVLAMSGGPVLASLLNSLALFGVQYPWIRPQWRVATAYAAQRLLRTGFLFLVLQSAAAVAYSSDNIVIAQVLGPKAVTQYSVPMRLFSIAPLLLGMILSPLWPAYGEAVARGDVTWAKKAFFRSILLALLVTAPFSVFLVLYGPQLIRAWVGTTLAPPTGLLLGLGVWTVMGSVGSAVGTFLNGLNAIRFQAICAVVMAVGAIIAKVTLAHSIGLSGVIWGSVLAYTLFTAVPVSILVLKIVPSMRASATTEDDRRAQCLS